MSSTSQAELEEAVNRLVDEWRDRALWFLREDYYPHTDAERQRTLDYIAQRADFRTYQRVAQLRRWLSQESNATSADS